MDIYAICLAGYIYFPSDVENIAIDNDNFNHHNVNNDETILDTWSSIYWY